MIVRATALAGTLALAACVQDRQQLAAVDAPVFGRADCQRAEGNPEIQQDYERARTVCMGRAEAGAAAASSNIPVGRGVDAIFTGAQRGMTERRVGEATVVSCMAENGYLLRTKAGHIAACEAIAEHKAKKRP